jgi:hypothetical protein
MLHWNGPNRSKPAMNSKILDLFRIPDSGFLSYFGLGCGCRSAFFAPLRCFSGRFAFSDVSAASLFCQAVPRLLFWDSLVIVRRDGAEPVAAHPSLQ